MKLCQIMLKKDLQQLTLNNAANCLNSGGIEFAYCEREDRLFARAALLFHQEFTRSG